MSIKNNKYSHLDQLLLSPEDEPELIHLLSPEEEEENNSADVPEVLPILPLRNTVLFPGVVVPITVGRDKSIALIKDANKGNRTIGVIAQKSSDIEDPSPADLHQVGTIANIVKMLKMPDGNITAIIQGKRRFTVTGYIETKPYFTARVSPITEPEFDTNKKDFTAVMATIKDLAKQIIHASPNIPSEAVMAIKNIKSPRFLLNFISGNLNVELDEKQALLETLELGERANKVLEILAKELQMLEIKSQINDKVKTDIDKQQRDFYLQQQMKAIQEELGDAGQQKDMEALRLRAKDKKWKPYVAETFNKELSKLGRMNPAAAEYSVIYNYLELLLDLPWDDVSKDDHDLKRGEIILNRDHYGLDKVKRRILEFLAVLKLKGDMKSPILCLLGPPGVGKTSLGKSVAEALGRKYVRISLGGMRDEAEIRGHRKTYIGAMPGRIIQSIKKAKTSNPVMVLDEIEKIGSDFRGDPASALLEVLDPEQNTAFYDYFLELDYDLSKVLFIATANSLDSVHPALRDRMEVIDLSGYLLEEKVQIAKKHLLPKQLKEHGLKPENLKISESVLSYMIDYYTRESGVRNLEKLLASVARSRAKDLVFEIERPTKLTKHEVEEILGPVKFDKDTYKNKDLPGVVNGLAWTPVGGDVLYIETSLSPGKGRITLTGKLGDVMKESASIALSYLKSHYKKFGIQPVAFDKWDIHVHVPEGAVPKEGPSAGITMLTALASLFTQRKVRPDVAMTGEITLRGIVLPVGGIKEKILAAKRLGIDHIILSESNKKDVGEISERYVEGLTFHYVKKMDEVLEVALLKERVPNAIDVNQPEYETQA
ncbi:MAG: endopeptidase La [Bacteroidetes bacterium]|nr:endopeptidase La [Bacteroidota bacterium]